ncbi:MAG: hypothetical protein ACP5OP_07430 [Leptospirillia bacterium]
MRQGAGTPPERPGKAWGSPGEAFVDVGQKAYEERYHQRVVKNLERRAREMGFVLTPAPV